jgi:hypothetical protein
LLEGEISTQRQNVTNAHYTIKYLENELERKANQNEPKEKECSKLMMNSNKDSKNQQTFTKSKN